MNTLPKPQKYAKIGLIKSPVFAYLGRKAPVFM
jgi:hypothetical protein